MTMLFWRMGAVRMVIPCNFPVGCIRKLHVRRDRDGPARVRPRRLPHRPQLIRRAAERAVTGVLRSARTSGPARGRVRVGGGKEPQDVSTIHPRVEKTGDQTGDKNELARTVHP
jgi:hypothetical protein